MALALGATVMVALFGMYEGVLDASEQIRRRSVSERAVRVVLGLIEDDLRSLCVVEGAGVNVLGNEFEEDTGASGEVVLAMTTSATVDLDSRLPHLGVQAVEYVLETMPDGDRLVRRERPYAGIEGDFDWMEIVLLESVGDMDIGFWSTGFNEFTDDWELMEGTELPLAVRVALELANETGGERSYELVIPLGKGLEEEES